MKKRILTLFALAVVTVGAWAQTPELPYISIQKSGGFAATPMTPVETRSDSDVSATYELELTAGNHKFWIVSHLDNGSGSEITRSSGDYNITVPEPGGKVYIYATHLKNATYTSVVCNAMSYATIEPGWVMYARLLANIGASSSEYYFYSKDDGAYKRLQLAYASTYQNKPETTKHLFLIPSTGSEIGGLQITSNAVANRVCKAVLDYTTGTLAYSAVTSYPVKVGSAGVATLVLPMEATIPSGVKAYMLKYDGSDQLKGTEVVGTIPANTPVLLNANKGIYDFNIGTATATPVTAIAKHNNNNKTYICDIESTDDNILKGVYMPHVVPMNSYVLQNGSSGVGFYKVTVDNSYVIDPFRCYVTLPDAEARSLSIVFDDEETTGIADVRGQKEDVRSDIFNLSGQRVGKDYKGVVIKNGRKMIQK